MTEAISLSQDEFRFIPNTETIVGKRTTYSQVWSAYNKAQTREKIIVYALLNELLSVVKLDNVTIDKKVGRPPLDLRNAIFALFIKVYMNKSSRRVISELELAKRAQYLTHVPHFNTLHNSLNERHLEFILKDLITISSIVLKEVECHFAVDATGFSTSMYGRWFSIRTASASMRRMYMKCHAMVGTTTNIITSVEVTKGTAADVNHLQPLVGNTAPYFDIEEVSADKAYSTRQNHGIIDSLGATPYIPFKSNAIGAPKSFPIWRKMYDEFHDRTDEFRKHYHRRSNVETTFSMIKKKFGTHLKSRNELGQRNEILLKCLAHNLAVITQEIFELGIDIDFNKCAETVFAQKQG